MIFSCRKLGFKGTFPGKNNFYSKYLKKANINFFLTTIIGKSIFLPTIQKKAHVDYLNIFGDMAG